MRIAIIGAGNVGGAIARGATKAGHDVTVGDNGSGKARTVAEGIGASAADDLGAAAAAADVIVLAVPYQAAAGFLGGLGAAVDGKVVVDATNPLNADYSGLAVTDRSGAEEIQAAAPGARVVKAFNTAFAANQDAGVVDGEQLDGFYAGDDAGAKETAAQLLAEIGFRPVDAGPLSAARALEHMAFLNISLNATRGWSWRSGWKLVGPTAWARATALAQPPVRAAARVSRSRHARSHCRVSAG